MKTIVKSLVIIFLLLKHSLSFSQVDPGDPGNDPGQTVPIDNHIFPILFLAVLFPVSLSIPKVIGFALF